MMNKLPLLLICLGIASSAAIADSLYCPASVTDRNGMLTYNDGDLNTLPDNQMSASSSLYFNIGVNKFIGAQLDLENKKVYCYYNEQGSAKLITPTGYTSDGKYGWLNDLHQQSSTCINTDPTKCGFVKASSSTKN